MAVDKSDINQIKDDLRKITEVLLGDGKEVGLVSRVRIHCDWIKDQREKEKEMNRFRIDWATWGFRLFIGTIVTVILYKLGWK